MIEIKSDTINIIELKRITKLLSLLHNIDYNCFIDTKDNYVIAKLVED